RHSALAVIQQLTNTSARRRICVSAFLVPRPPVCVRSRAVERSRSRYRNVLLLECIDERRVVHALCSLESRVNDGQIFLRVCAEFERRAFGDVQIDVALQMNRASQENSGGNDHATTARAVAGFNRLAYGFGRISLAICNRAVIRDLEIARSTNRRLDARKNRRHSIPSNRSLASIVTLSRAHQLRRLKQT